MNSFTTLLIIVVAIIHFYFLYLEMFLWTKPKGLKTFGITKEFAEQSKIMAANQGLYNGFLASGLLWSLFTAQVNTQIFFLSCVIVAGIYGSISLKKKAVFFFQSVPAILTILIIFINKL